MVLGLDWEHIYQSMSPSTNGRYTETTVPLVGQVSSLKSASVREQSPWVCVDRSRETTPVREICAGHRAAKIQANGQRLAGYADQPFTILQLQVQLVFR